MRVIGIDPGSRICGWGVIEESGGPQKLRHIDCGGVFVDPKLGLPERLRLIYEGLREQIRRCRPDEAALESVFHHKNARSALVLGHARGAALLACLHESLPIYEYTPAQIKQAVAGYGRAEKAQVAAMVKALLRLPEVAMADAADALAGAICHLNSRGMRRALERLDAKRGGRR
jgi:crossover junction endodeoxyribonuclease RuvC